MKDWSYRAGLLLVTGSAIAWSMAGLFTRAIPLDVWTMLVWRGAFGAAGVLAVIVLFQGSAGLRRFAALGRPGCLFVVVSAGGMICFITALRHTTVAHVAVIYAAVPFVAAVLGWLLIRERPSSSAIWASVMALAGVAVMVGLGTEGNWRGDVLAFGMIAAMAVMMVLPRRYPSVPAIQAACASALLSGLVCLPFAMPLDVSSNELGLLALFGLVNSAAGLALFTLGARRLPPIETALIGALDAPLAPLWVWFAFGDTPDLMTAVGGSIVFSAVCGHIVLTARRENQPNIRSI